MKLKLVSRCLAVSTCLLMSPVFSQTADAPATNWGFQTKPYVQASLGGAQMTSPSNTGMAMNLRAEGMSNFSDARITVGLQFKPRLAVEATWYQFPGANLNTATGQATYKGEFVSVGLTGNVAVKENITLLGRVGLGYSDLKVSVPATGYWATSNQNVVTWGLGARYSLNERVDLTVDYDNLGTAGKYERGDYVKAEVFSLGLRYNF
ncbi:MAG: outer membrane beta-barrel protein [Rhodoferax sp.]|nr:outer membrane beta-barrel protein [Rhodoferax sp.]